ncbi:hypothetical protein P692DRAFT_20756845 [Suillus brevipes Sb2]|nr:hypothetical protein P692DRAFT_20756845 [Suillus brevipes Sb2]
MSSLDQLTTSLPKSIAFWTCSDPRTNRPLHHYIGNQTIVCDTFSWTIICEQTNVWLGGCWAILRGMSAHQYNLYLNAMIKLQNRYVISESERRGHYPWMISIVH